MQNVPYSSVWGPVTHTAKDEARKNFVLVTVATQVLRLEHTRDCALETLGLLRLSKKGQKVFLIFSEDEIDGKNILLAGWKNPNRRMVLELQPLVVEASLFDLKAAIRERSPVWKSWKGSFGSSSM